MINITELWNKAHAHLKPMGSHLPLHQDDQMTCFGCSGKAAFKVKARLKLDQVWVSHITPVYCPECFQFHIDDQDIKGQTLIDVDARLWSSQPTFLNIEPTTRCNFKCWYCVGRHMVQDDIDIDDFERVLENFPELTTIALVGEGEPLMHKSFFDMAHMAKARGIRVVIISNGSAFSESVIKKICESEIAYIGISIDSADPQTFANSRLEGNLKKIWSGIENLCKYRDENGFQYPKIGLKGTVFKDTQNEIPRIVMEAKSHGVEIFESFQPLNPKVTYTPIYPVQHLAEIAHIDEVAKSISRDSAFANEQMQSIDSFCEQEELEMNVGQPNGLRPNCDEKWIYSLLSGDVVPCCQLKTPMHEEWNLFKYPIKNILTDPNYENTRFNLWNGIFPNYCKGCWKTR